MCISNLILFYYKDTLSALSISKEHYQPIPYRASNYPHNEPLFRTLHTSVTSIIILWVNADLVNEVLVIFK